MKRLELACLMTDAVTPLDQNHSKSIQYQGRIRILLPAAQLGTALEHHLNPKGKQEIPK